MQFKYSEKSLDLILCVCVSKDGLYVGVYMYSMVESYVSVFVCTSSIMLRKLQN